MSSTTEGKKTFLFSSSTQMVPTWWTWWNPQMWDDWLDEGKDILNWQPRPEKTVDSLGEEVKIIKKIKEAIDKIKSWSFDNNDILQLQSLLKGLDISVLAEPLKSLILKIVEAINKKKHNKINRLFKKLLWVSNEDFQKTTKSIWEDIAKITEQQKNKLVKAAKWIVTSGLWNLAGDILWNSNIKSKDVNKFSWLINSLWKKWRDKMENLVKNAETDWKEWLSKLEVENAIEKELNNMETTEKIINNEQESNKTENNENVEIDNNLSNKEKTSKEAYLDKFDAKENATDKEKANAKRMKELILKVNKRELSTVKKKRNAEVMSEEQSRTEWWVIWLIEAFENAQDVVNNVTANIYKFPLVWPLLALWITNVRSTYKA